MKADLILKNIGKLVTMQGSSNFKVKEEMNNTQIIEDAYIAVKNGKILAIGVGDIFGNIIDINGEKVGTPFVIKAIGLPEQLAGLSRPGGYLEILKGASVGVELKKSNNITISKYTGVINYQYAQTVK